MSWYRYGMSFEDEQTEFAALEVRGGDRILAVASGGEIPLSLLSMADVEVVAVDPSPFQLYLAKLKLAASTEIGEDDAPGFLGFRQMPRRQREQCFSVLRGSLDEETAGFWSSHREAIAAGPVTCYRGGAFPRLAHRLALRLMGGRRLFAGLLDCETVEEQCRHVRQAFNARLFRAALAVCLPLTWFARRRLQLSADRITTSAWLDARCRDFCCATKARSNRFLQQLAFGRLVCDEALPPFLTREGVETLGRRRAQVRFFRGTIAEALEEYPVHHFTKIHLSNIGDFLAPHEFVQSLRLALERGAPGGRVTTRSSFGEQSLFSEVAAMATAETELADRLLKADRYPFFWLLPLAITGH